MNRLSILIAMSMLAVGVGAQNITGTITIKRKLTKRSVTASIPIYQRGATVKLGKDAKEDPLGFERSRVVIYLDGPGPGNVGAVPTPSMQQLDRQFSPDLLVVPVGSTVSFPNRDPIFHNVFSLSKGKAFDLGSYDQGESRNVVFSKPGIIYVYCHLHPNMEGAIVVTPNRWFAQSDSAGHFRIPNVPPGQYTVVAWHKAAGFFKKPIRIEAGHDSVADFFIPLGEDEPEKADASVGTLRNR